MKSVSGSRFSWKFPETGTRRKLVFGQNWSIVFSDRSFSEAIPAAAANHLQQGPAWPKSRCAAPGWPRPGPSLLHPHEDWPPLHWPEQQHQQYRRVVCQVVMTCGGFMFLVFVQGEVSALTKVVLKIDGQVRQYQRNQRAVIYWVRYEVSSLTTVKALFRLRWSFSANVPLKIFREQLKTTELRWCCWWRTFPATVKLLLEFPLESRFFPNFLCSCLCRTIRMSWQPSLLKKFSYKRKLYWLNIGGFLVRIPYY